MACSRTSGRARRPRTFPSSCSRRKATRTTRCASSSSAPTTFSPSHSARARCRRGWKPFSDDAADFCARDVCGHLRTPRCRRQSRNPHTPTQRERPLSRLVGNRARQHRTDELALIPVFAAFVAPGATVRLSEEHDRAEWLRARDAAQRFAWPRERRAVEDILSIVGGGDAGLLEDVLRVSY